MLSVPLIFDCSFDLGNAINFSSDKDVEYPLFVSSSMQKLPRTLVLPFEFPIRFLNQVFVSVWSPLMEL